MKKLLLPLLFMAITWSAQAQLVITEIFYNLPGQDSMEFVEIYNTSTTDINLTGYTMESRLVTTALPTITLNGGEFVTMTSDSAAFARAYGTTGYSWGSNSLTNSADSIKLFDNNGMLLDEVNYSSSDPWPAGTSGQGASLSFCDPTMDNSDPLLWRASTLSAGFSVQGTEIFANPNSFPGCTLNPVVRFLGNSQTVFENDDNLEIDIEMRYGNANETNVGIEVDALSDAIEGTDVDITPNRVVFDLGSMRDTQSITLDFLDDMITENTDTLILNLTMQTNSTISRIFETYTVIINDDDFTQTNAMVITGVIDAHPSNAGAKALEVQVLEDIPDLSIFGFGSANNGDGSDGVEFTFPSVSAMTGDCIYVADDSLLFRDFFGFDADYIDGRAISVNGDDAIELFENSEVIDVFGDINVDGNGTPWEYLDGWAYRKSGTGPDGSTFVLNNWTFSGPNALDNVANNASSSVPFLVCSYDPNGSVVTTANDDDVTVPFETTVVVNILGNDVVNGSPDRIFLDQDPSNGVASVNGDFSIDYTPNDTYCGPDLFSYILCDGGGNCDTANVNLTVLCPVNYPVYDIDFATTDSDGNLVPDSIGRDVELNGVVYGVNIRGNTTGVQFTLIDDTGGIGVFGPGYDDYTVMEGDRIRIQGSIGQFRGLTQIGVDTIIFVSNNNLLVEPMTVTELGESTESEFIQMLNVSFIDAAQAGDGFNARLLNGTDTIIARVDNDTGIQESDFPTSGSFNIRGIGGQFSSGTNVLDDGYQIAPRYPADIDVIISVNELDLTRVQVFPNPTSDQLTIINDRDFDQINLVDMLGRSVQTIAQPMRQLELSLAELPAGLYYLQFMTGEGVGTKVISKQ